MINAIDDELLTMDQAAELIPGRGGAKTSISTLWRWRKRGFGGVRLEVVKVGGMVYTTKAAVLDFISACNKGERKQ